MKVTEAGRVAILPAHPSHPKDVQAHRPCASRGVALEWAGACVKTTPEFSRPFYAMRKVRSTPSLRQSTFPPTTQHQLSFMLTPLPSSLLRPHEVHGPVRTSGLKVMDPTGISRSKAPPSVRKTVQCKAKCMPTGWSYGCAPTSERGNPVEMPQERCLSWGKAPTFPEASSPALGHTGPP